MDFDQMRAALKARYDAMDEAGQDTYYMTYSNLKHDLDDVEHGLRRFGVID